MKAKLINEELFVPKNVEDFKDRLLLTDIKDDGDEITFTWNYDLLKAFLRKTISGINSNEIERYLVFEMERILENIPDSYFVEGNEYKIHNRIKMDIERSSSWWLSLHGDDVMRKGL